MRALRDNSLSLFFAVLLIGSLVGQSVAGWHDYNADQLAHNESTVTWAYYLTSAPFWAAVMENWQSEFLQFSLFILATVWLIQRGSNESKPPEDAGLGIRPETADRRVCAGQCSCVGGRAGVAHQVVLELAPHRDDDDLLLDLVRSVADGQDRIQRRTDGPRRRGGVMGLVFDDP